MFDVHEARNSVLSELHARPFLPLRAPSRIYHFAFATTDAEARTGCEALFSLCPSLNESQPAEETKFLQFPIANWNLRWEQHTEFATYTWSTDEQTAVPFSRPDPLGQGELRFQAPGKLVVAIHLSLIDEEQSNDQIAATFNPQSLCLISVEARSARVASDFQVDEHGFTRFLIATNGMSEAAVGRLVQRVIEIETYRTLALLGLPEARRAGSELARMEHEIFEITFALSEAAAKRTSQELLGRLGDLLAQSEAQSARTAFRFGASRAYHALVRSKLDLIGESKEGAHTTITEFFSARLDPAIETCNAIEARQARLSQQLSRTADLLRTGIQFGLEQQNRDLLADMNQRARQQARLQRTVQGLSIAALSYYLSGLTTYLAKGAKDAGFLPNGVTAEMVAAVAIPFTVLFAWAFMERVRRLSLAAPAQDHKQDAPKFTE